MKHILIAALVAALLAAPAAAANLDGTPAGAGGPDLAALKSRIDNGDAAGAETELRAAGVADPGNADILNLLGYAHRKLGRYGSSRTYYTRALALDPRHRGALEYMGELELETGDPEAARALLARLRDVCPSGCEELDDLIRAFGDRGVTTEGGES